MKKYDNKNIRCFKHLAQEVTGDPNASAYYVGRTLYKYTDCGPWTVFYVPDRPARTDYPAAIIEYVRKEKNIRIRDVGFADEHLNSMVRDHNPRFAQFLGFEEDGSNKAWPAPFNLTKYIKLLKRFMRETKRDVHRDYDNLTVARLDRDTIQVCGTKNHAATTKSIYYEDKAAGRAIHRCVGIGVGSIVEGSDVEIDERRLNFPFTKEEFLETVKGVNDEASFYWERDNYAWFLVNWHDADGSQSAIVTPGWGEGEFKGLEGQPLDDKQKARLEKFIRDKAEKMEEDQNKVHKVRIGKTTFYVEYYVNSEVW